MEAAGFFDLGGRDTLCSCMELQRASEKGGFACAVRICAEGGSGF